MPRRGRFLFVTFESGGGGGGNITATLPLIGRLVRRGHEVKVLASRGLAAV